MSEPASPSAAPSAGAPVTDAVLWVSHPELALERFGGMYAIERQLFTAARAGVRRIWVAASRADPRMRKLRLPDGLETHWVEPGDRRPESCRPPYAAISGDHVIRREALRAILAAPHARPTAYQDAERRGVVQIVPSAGDRWEDYEKRELPADASRPVETGMGRGPSVAWLLNEARKATDSFMARHFDRNISLAVTRRLLGTRVLPTHMTLFSTAVGLAGTAMLLDGGYGWCLAGAVSVWLHTVLDGVDGELARLRFQESRLGGVIDFWGDNLVHFSLFSCLGTGRWRATGDPVLLGLGWAAAFAALASAWLVYRHTAEKARARTPGGPFFQGVGDLAGPGADGARPGALKRALAKVEDTLTQRDFVYLLVALAAVGTVDLGPVRTGLDAFLWMSGIGSPLFAGVFLLLKRRA